MNYWNQIPKNLKINTEVYITWTPPQIPEEKKFKVEIYKTVLFFRLLCKAPSAIFRLHTVLTKNLFFILQSMVRGNLLATAITFQFCFYCHFLYSKNNFYSVHFPPNSTLISLILCCSGGAHTWKRDDLIPWRVNYILVNNLNCHQSIIFLASFFESRYFYPSFIHLIKFGGNKHNFKELHLHIYMSFTQTMSIAMKVLI